MHPYSQSYLDDAVEAQGKLFDSVSSSHPSSDTEAFITAYMTSRLRSALDNGQPYVLTMSGNELMDYYLKTESPAFVPGESMKGFVPDWIGEFYAYYQWYYGIPSSEVVRKVPVAFLKKAYYGLHDLDLECAVRKVGGEE